MTKIVNQTLTRSASGLAIQFDSSKANSELKDTSNRLLNGQKQLSLQEADAQGVRRELDNLTRQVTMVKGFQSQIALSRVKLSTEEKAVNELQDILQTLIVDDANLYALNKTKMDISNDAFDRVQRVLTTKVNGEYIFGGAHSQENPILHDIKSRDTFIEGVVEVSNYTHSIPDNTELNISSSHSIRDKVLHAGSPEIAQLISFIHAFCKDEDPAHLERLKVKVTESLENASADIRSNILDLSSAADENDVELGQLIQSLEEITSIDFIDETSKLKDLMESMKAFAHIQRALNDVDEDFFRTAVPT